MNKHNIKLSVNLNKIALIRNSREGDFPRLLDYARMAIDNGAQGITVHPRPDQRHITAKDITDLHEFMADVPHIEFNIEGNPFASENGSYPGFIDLVLNNKPHQCTLVPDSDSQLTSDHGFDLRGDNSPLQEKIAQLKQHDIRISLFMDADIEQISLAKEMGADRIELYTGPFAEAYARDLDTGKHIFYQHQQAAKHANQIGLGINAGHDLNLHNLTLYRTLPYLEEVSIGHALTVDALNEGYCKTVQAYEHVLKSGALDSNALPAR